MSKPKKEVVITEEELLAELERVSSDQGFSPSESGWFTTEQMADIYGKKQCISADSALRHVRKLLKVALIEGKLDDTGHLRKRGLGKFYPCRAYRFILGKEK